MKKLITIAFIGMSFFPVLSHAQEVTLSVQTREELIASLKAQIEVLLQLYIQALQNQLATLLANQATQTQSINTQTSVIAQQTSTINQIQTTQQSQNQQIQQIVTQTSGSGVPAPVATSTPEVLEPEVSVTNNVCTDPSLPHDEHGNLGKIFASVFGDTWTTGEIRFEGIADNQWNRYGGGVAIYKVIKIPYGPTTYFSNPVFIREAVPGTYTVTSIVKYDQDTKTSTKQFTVVIKDCE